MSEHDAYLEKTWNAILSRDEKEILRVFSALDPDSRRTVVEHLKKMTAEDGWHPEQVKSAGRALQVIYSEGNSNGHSPVDR